MVADFAAAPAGSFFATRGTAAKTGTSWAGVVRASRRPLRDLLRMRNFFNAIKVTPSY
jgi:hypothetical protein